MPNDESKPSYTASGYSTELSDATIEYARRTRQLASKISVGCITIDLQTGEVEAPSLEAASEAGRVFVESVRGYLSPENERARIVAYLRDLGLSIELRGVSGAIHLGLADAIAGGAHLTPITFAPEGA